MNVFQKHNTETRKTISAYKCRTTHSSMDTTGSEIANATPLTMYYSLFTEIRKIPSELEQKALKKPPSLPTSPLSLVLSK
jgi:hypothetical protein